MKSRWHKLAKVVVWAGLQVLFFVLMYELTMAIIVQQDPIRSDLSYGLKLVVGFYLLCLLSVIHSAVQVLASGYKPGEIITALICMGTWVAFWSHSFTYRPYRAGLVIVLGFISFAIPVLLNLIYLKRWN